MHYPISSGGNRVRSCSSKVCSMEYSEEEAVVAKYAVWNIPRRRSERARRRTMNGRRESATTALGDDADDDDNVDDEQEGER